MRIIVDGYGGDNAPLAVLAGCEQAINEFDIDITITGDEADLKKVAKENNINVSRFKFENTTQIIPVTAEPSLLMTEYKDSSMAKAFRLLANGEGDAVVCAGSTGAIVIGASLIVKRIKGIKRAALAPIMPGEGVYLLLDVGANLDCRPEMLEQFALMGSIYMEKVMDIKSPRVALANIGAEETKGTQMLVDTYNLLKANKNFNFIGNIEPRYVPLGGADVVVCDGFTGNVILKLSEGLGKMFSNNIKNIFSGILGKISGLLVYSKIKAFKKKMDYKEYGGAPLLGTQKPVVKAHGSSDARAFKNAIRQAVKFSKEDVVGITTECIQAMKQNPNNNY